MLKIGGHVSTSGGILNAIGEANKIGANTIQIFGASPVQWKAPLPDKKIADEFSALSKKFEINPVFLHAPYLINLASRKGNMAVISKELLKKHLEIANSIGAYGVIFHIGSRGQRPQKEAEELIVKELKEIFSVVKNGKLIVENSAGAGNLVGSSIEEVGSIVKKVGEKRLGFCLDTAHAFESGILADFSKKGVSDFAKKIHDFIGKEKLWVIHLNDSKTPAGSNKDRHENIGQGKIGEDNFHNFLAEKFFCSKPLILEVPGYDDNGPDKKNVEIVKKMCQN